MAKQYSIAQARDRLPALVHEVEKGQPVELTRRGRPVAVVMSIQDYERMTPNRPSLYDAIMRWRESVDVEELNFTEEEFADLRDRSPGRDFQW